MGRETSNIGETGVKSIRLKGMKIEDLPMAMQARVAPQMAIAEDTERQHKANGILKKYPTQRVDYLEGRIRECRTSMEGMNTLMLQEQKRIQEYQGHIEMCKHRDRMIDKLDPVEDADEIKALKRQFPYVIDRLEAQIQISNESIERFQEVVRREASDIEELSAVKALCVQRDVELKAIGLRQKTGN